MLSGSCHCGAVQIALPSAPETATRCNCSLCRRLGALWAYYPFGTVTFEGHPEHTETYVQGDAKLTTVRCGHCGCATHWAPRPPKAGALHGVNLSNFAPDLVATVRVRQFDGADTGRFID